jgi:RNA polymerase sigma-70 factor (ECF subfamily)
MRGGWEVDAAADCLGSRIAIGDLPGTFLSEAGLRWLEGVGVGGTLKAALIVAGVGSHDLDLELAQRHGRGDLRAFDEVYSRYAAMVFNLALRLSGDGDEAADLTQEIFLRVFRHLDSFSGRSALKTWIFRVALNHCRERMSRFRPLTLPIGDEVDGAGVAGAAHLADPRRGPEELAVAADLGRQVAHALAQLPPPFREAVVLRDLQGLSYQEIAAVLGVRVGTVRSRIARGREQLRQLLDRRGAAGAAPGPESPESEPAEESEET